MNIEGTWRTSTVIERIRVLLDANVVLDVLGARQPFFPMAAGVWAAVEEGKVDGLLAAHTVTTLHYLLRRHGDAPRTATALADLLRVFEVAPVDGDVLQSALAIPGPDFEDAVQIAAAIAAGATHLVTRNPADFQACPIPILQPAELIALITAT